MARTSLKDFARVWISFISSCHPLKRRSSIIHTGANEAVPSNCLGIYGAFEQKGVLGICADLSALVGDSAWISSTNVADILRYASVGVRMSAGIVAYIGITLGGLEVPSKDVITSWIVFRDGLILSY